MDTSCAGAGGLHAIPEGATDALDTAEQPLPIFTLRSPPEHPSPVLMVRACLLSFLPSACHYLNR